MHVLLDGALALYDGLLPHVTLERRYGAGLPRVSVDPEQMRRVVLNLVDNQVRSLRKRQTIDAFKSGVRKGTYWGIRTDIGDYGLADALPCPHTRTLTLAETATRLNRLPDDLQERLINWGYAVCDAAMRAHVDASIARPAGFPYPASGV